jgi:ABC-type multidrug transport system ATPase subunit
MTSTIIYDIQDLTKQYPKQLVPVNKNISLQIYEGEIFGLLGDNGAGKTTLVRQMVNLQSSTSGKIFLFGKEIACYPHLVPLYVGYMPQESDALYQLTVSEALYFTAHLRGLSRTDARKERERLLDMWELGPLRDKHSNRISGGQKRLLRLAVATAGSRPVLILDEPTNDLDPQKRKLVWDTLRFLNREQGITIIFVTHDALEAEKIIQRVGIMRTGRFVALDYLSNVKQVVADKMRLEIFFTPENPPQLPADLHYHELDPGRWLLLLNWDDVVSVMNELRRDQFVDLRLYTATLEDVYLYYATQ